MDNKVRKMEIFIDGEKFTKEKALHEAKNCFGVGEGVELLASELVGNRRHESKGERLYQSDKKAYIRNAITRGVYDVFLAGNALLAHIEDNPAFLDALVAILDTNPPKETIDIEAERNALEEVGFKLQEMIENTGMEGAFEYSDTTLIIDYVE